MRGSRHTVRIGLMIGLAVLAAAGCRTDQTPARQARDMAITAEVKTKLASEVNISTITNIDVNTTNGVVTLSGQVGDEDVRRRAEQVARNTPNVVQVYNHLQVQQAAAPPPTDERRPETRPGD